MWSSEWLFATSIRWSTGPGGWGQVVIELPAGPNWNQAIFCRPSQVALHLVVPVITLFTGVLSELFCSFHPKKLPVHSNKRVIDPSSLNTLLSFINPAWWVVCNQVETAVSLHCGKNWHSMKHSPNGHICRALPLCKNLRLRLASTHQTLVYNPPLYPNPSHLNSNPLVEPTP